MLQNGDDLEPFSWDTASREERKQVLQVQLGKLKEDLQTTKVAIYDAEAELKIIEFRLLRQRVLDSGIADNTAFERAIYQFCPHCGAHGVDCLDVVPREVIDANPYWHTDDCPIGLTFPPHLKEHARPCRVCDQHEQLKQIILEHV